MEKRDVEKKDPGKKLASWSKEGGTLPVVNMQMSFRVVTQILFLSQVLF